MLFKLIYCIPFYLNNINRNFYLLREAEQITYDFYEIINDFKQINEYYSLNLKPTTKLENAVEMYFYELSMMRKIWKKRFK